MGVSIYYKFKSSNDLNKNGFLKGTEEMWAKAFDGSPYESWCWYEPLVEKKIFRKVYTYEGATSLPLDEDLGPKSAVFAVNLLTKIRRKVEGFDWSVQFDDLEVQWDEDSKKFQLV